MLLSEARGCRVVAAVCWAWRGVVGVGGSIRCFPTGMTSLCPPRVWTPKYRAYLRGCGVKGHDF